MKVERRLAYTSSQFMADAIVCTVDASGNPDTSDSREAFKAGGQELEKCSSALPSIPLGEALVVPGFNLRNRCVILVRSIHYNDDIDPENELHKTWRSILRLCAEQKIKSLAVPIIGAGHSQFPRQVCVQILLQSLVKEAPQLAPNLALIRICLPIRDFDFEFALAMQLSDPTDRRPKTVEAAVEYVMRSMSKSALQELAALKGSQLIQLHFGLAAWIRNEVLSQNPALFRATGCRHRDDASSVIVKALWSKLQCQSETVV
jgi:O-acetyl-ADP-ribose deacetylase (regulator of RNase III)